MKKITLLLVCISLALCALAQTQQGYVRTIGKPGKKGVALSGVTVRAKGNHNAVVSKSNGRFSMKMKGLKNGDAYSLQQVQKNGYELNDVGTIGRQYAFSSTVPLTIVMISTAQLQADKQRIENNAYAVAEKNYKAKMAKLEKQLNENTITAEEYRAALQELQDSFEKYQSLIESLADHYAHTDYDMLDENEAKINTLIENGELEKADSSIHTLFDPIDVLKRNKEALERLDQTIADAQGIIDQANADLAAVLKQQEKDAEYLYQLYTIALAQFDNERAAKYIQTRAELDTTNVKWLNDAGLFIENYLNDYTLALEYYQKCLTQVKSQYGNHDVRIGILYDNIGGVYDNTEQYQLSIYYRNLSIEILEHAAGKANPALATTFNNLGLTYFSLGDTTEALKYYQKSMDIYNSLGEGYNPAELYNNLGLIYYYMNDYEKALLYYSMALDLHENELGTEHFMTAQNYNNVGAAYLRLGEKDKGLECIMKALTIREKIFGPNHPKTASSYHNLGGFFDIQGEYEKARVYYFKTIEALGPKDSHTAYSYYNIACTYFKQGQYDEAINHFERAIEIIERLNPNHPLAQKARDNIEEVKAAMEHTSNN